MFLDSKFKDVYKKIVKTKLSKLEIPLKRYVTKIEVLLDNILKKNKLEGFLVEKLAKTKITKNRFSNKFGGVFGNSGDNGPKIQVMLF